MAERYKVLCNLFWACVVGDKEYINYRFLDSLNGQHSASQPYLLTVGLTEEGKSQRSIDCGNADDPLGLGKPFPRSARCSRSLIMHNM